MIKLKKLMVESRFEKYNKLRPLKLFTEMKKVTAYKSDALTSKMWILPSGKVVSLDQWHYRWILANSTIVSKFGIDTKTLPDDEEIVRNVALKKGFFRVNYEHRYGSMVVEGLKSKLDKRIKDAIFMVVMDNIGAIDKIQLSLFNNDLTKVVGTEYAELFKHRNEEDKIAALGDVLNL